MRVFKSYMRVTVSLNTRSCHASRSYGPHGTWQVDGAAACVDRPMLDFRSPPVLPSHLLSTTHIFRKAHPVCHVSQLSSHTHDSPLCAAATTDAPNSAAAQGQHAAQRSSHDADVPGSVGILHCCLHESFQQVWREEGRARGSSGTKICDSLEPGEHVRLATRNHAHHRTLGSILAFTGCRRRGVSRWQRGSSKSAARCSSSSGAASR